MGERFQVGDDFLFQGQICLPGIFKVLSIYWMKPSRIRSRINLFLLSHDSPQGPEDSALGSTHFQGKRPKALDCFSYVRHPFRVWAIASLGLCPLKRVLPRDEPTASAVQGGWSWPISCSARCVFITAVKVVVALLAVTQHFSFLLSLQTTKIPAIFTRAVAKPLFLLSLCLLRFWT